MGTAWRDKPVLVASLMAGLMLGQQAAVKVVRDALFLSSYSATRLPVAIIAASVAAIASAAVMSRLTSRHAPSRVLLWITVAASACLIVEWALTMFAPRLAAAALYIHVSVFGGVAVSGFWSCVNERFDPLAAKSAVARIGLGGSCGVLAGGAAVWAAARLIGVPALLPVLAGLGLVVAMGTGLLAGPRAEAAARSRMESAESAVQILRRVSYLRVLGLVVACGAVADAILHYVFKAAAAAAIRDPAALASFFGAVSTSVAVLGLAMQTGPARACVARLGLAGTVALRPAAVIVASVAGLVEPGLGAAFAARACHDVATPSLFRAGYEPLFTPLPASEKRPTKALVDVAIDKLGNLLGSALVLAVLALTPAPGGVLFAVLAALCAAALVLTPRLHRGYVATLAQNLRAGRVTIEDPASLDEATRSTLMRVSPGRDGRAPRPAVERPPVPDPVMEAVTALRSRDPERILRGLATAGSSAALAGHVIPLLQRDDLFPYVVRALRSARPAPIGQLVDALLDPSMNPIVRSRVARVLKRLPDARTAEGLLLGLRDPHPGVRAHCGHALAVVVRRDRRLRPAPERVLSAVDLELARAACDVDLDYVFTLIALALDRQSVRLALEALRRSEDESGTALEYLANVLPPRVRDSLWPRLTKLRPARRRSPETSTEASSAAVPIDRAAVRVQLLAADAVRN